MRIEILCGPVSCISAACRRNPSNNPWVSVRKQACMHCHRNHAASRRRSPSCPSAKGLNRRPFSDIVRRGAVALAAGKKLVEVDVVVVGAGELQHAWQSGDQSPVGSRPVCLILVSSVNTPYAPWVPRRFFLVALSLCLSGRHYRAPHGRGSAPEEALRRTGGEKTAMLWCHWGWSGKPQLSGPSLALITSPYR